MVKKAAGAYWTDEEIKQEIEEWRQKRPQRIKDGKWRLDEIPFYEKGLPHRTDIWHRVDFLDEYDLTWEKKWGASGIGKLREVALCRPTEAENFLFEDEKPTDPEYFGRKGIVDLENWQKEHDLFAQCLRDNGVKVNYINYPQPPVGAHGVTRSMYAAREIQIVWGGALIPRFGWTPQEKGRERIYAEWLVKQGCPILYTIIGRGFGDTGALQPLADDTMIIPRGLCFNQEGIDQIRWVLAKVGITNTPILDIASWLRDMSWPGRGAFHPGMLTMPVDLGKQLIYPSNMGWEMVKWFRDHKYELIEIDADEQRDFCPTSLIVLQPGKVIMNSAAKKTIAKVRRAGVQVIETPYYEAVKQGHGGLYCAVMQLVRDRGPKLADIK